MMISLMSCLTFSVRYLHHFDFRNHICIVFELLGCNLYDVIRQSQFKGVPLSAIRDYAYQIFVALEFLRSPSVGIIHCDLKPENILICQPGSTNIKVIDFGSSCKIGHTVHRHHKFHFLPLMLSH